MFASLCWIAWKLAMRLPERVPLERIPARDVVRRLRDPERLRGDPDPAAVEGRHRDAETSVLLVQEPVTADVRVDHDVVRDRRVEPELLLVPGHADMVGVEHECADSARAAGVRVRPREQ